MGRTKKAKRGYKDTEKGGLIMPQRDGTYDSHLIG